METVFWNVDTQYDFMRNDRSHKGALPVERARVIESRLEELTRIAADREIRVVNTADWHKADSREISDTPDFQTTFPAHCLQGTKGARYVPATRPKNPYVVDWQEAELDERAVLEHRNIVLLKDAFDVFAGNPHTDRVLELIRPEQAVVYGVATNVCVDFAVKGLIERGVKVYVSTDATKELPNLPLEETLAAWEKLGATLTTAREVLKYLR